MVSKQWCIPPKANGEFVYHMEDVLSVYTRPYDERRPLVCLDEASKQMLKDKRERLPLRPGDPEYYDSEYEREGVCSIFVASAPLAGQRYLQVREQRTKKDWAEFVRELIDIHSSLLGSKGLSGLIVVISQPHLSYPHQIITVHPFPLTTLRLCYRGINLSRPSLYLGRKESVVNGFKRL